MNPPTTQPAPKKEPLSHDMTTQSSTAPAVHKISDKPAEFVAGVPTWCWCEGLAPNGWIEATRPCKQCTHWCSSPAKPTTPPSLPREPSDTELLEEIISVLSAASRDIHEHLQVCIRNVYGRTRDGLHIGIPETPIVIHEQGIKASEAVEAKIDALISKLARIRAAMQGTTP